MADLLTQHAERRSGRILRFVEYLLFCVGATLLGFYGYFTFDAHRTQQDAREMLAQAVTLEAAARVVERGPAAASPPTVIPVVRGAAVGEIVIPRINLSAVVLHGSDARTLRRGPGHIETTAFPGQPGNAAIAGHRDTFFRPLRDIQRGDDIFVQTPAGRFHYRVVSTQVVAPQDLSVLEPTREPTLTLITCYPFWVFGSAPDRFIVRAVQVTSDAGESAPAPAVEWREVADAPPVRPASAQTRSPRPPDDETLVRQAVERFRQAYNARVVANRDGLPASPLVFERCDISREGDDAIAACEPRPLSGHDAGSGELWLLTLARAESGWAIRSVQSP